MLVLLIFTLKLKDAGRDLEINLHWRQEHAAGDDISWSQEREKCKKVINQ